MRAVGFVTAATAGGCRLSDLAASHRSSYRNATVSSFASPDRSTSPVGPMVGLAQ